MNHFLLDFLSLAAILSGILVIVSKNPVISVFFLISVFVNVAGYLLLLGVGFIGISYLIVYVGAIAILFLFVVMMLNLQLAELSAVGKEYTQNLPLGLLIGSLFVFELISLLPFTSKDVGTSLLSNGSLVNQAELGMFHWITSFFLPENSDSSHLSGSEDTTTYLYSTFAKYTPNAADITFANFHQIQSIGQNLYTSGSIWLLVASVILLLAMVGPIILTLTSRNRLVRLSLIQSAK
jgi:NADH-ubiquinone oxidoreductase chain 6